jgi:hypothetical protein
MGRPALLRARRRSQQFRRARGVSRIRAESGLTPDECQLVSARRLAKLLVANRTNEDKWIARCPAHDDQKPSLSIAEGHSGRCLVHCFAGCTPEAVFAALQEQYNVRPKGSAAHRQLVNAAPLLVSYLPVYPFDEEDLATLLEQITEKGGKSYRYRDESGSHVLFVHARFKDGDGKRFLPYYSNGQKIERRWPHTVPPYRLNHLTAQKHLPVLIVEGEKTALAAQKRFPTTYVVITWAGGSDAVNRTDWRAVVGRDVVIWPDNDDAGKRAAAALVAQCRANAAKSVRVVDVPSAFPANWDLADPLPKGYSRRTLTRLLLSATAPQPTSGGDAVDLLDKQLPEPDEILPGIVPEGLTLLVGKAKSRKSFFALRLSVAVVSGGSFLGVNAKKGSVLYVSFEDSERTIQGRLRTMAAGTKLPRGLHIEYRVPRYNEGGKEELCALIRALKPRLVVLDTIKWFTRPAARGTNQYDSDHAAFAEVSQIAKEHGISILGVHHTRKAIAIDRLDETSGSTAVIGIADTVLMMGVRGLEGELLAKGRNVREQTLAMRFNENTLTWELRDGRAKRPINETYRTILGELSRAGIALSPKLIVNRTGLNHQTIRTALRRMESIGLIQRVRNGLYGVLSE